MVLCDQKSDSTFHEMFENEISDTLEGKNHVSADNGYQTEKYNVRNGLAIPRNPREAFKELFTPDLFEFSDQLTNDDIEPLPKTHSFEETLKCDLSIDRDDVEGAVSSLNQTI